MTIDQTSLEKASKDLMEKLTESFDQLAQSMDQLWASFYIILTELFEVIEEAFKNAVYKELVVEHNAKTSSDNNKPSISDVSATQDVITDIKTPRSIENTNPDYYKQELARRDEKIAELLKVYGECKDAIARRDEELALTEKKLCNIDRSAMEEIARRDEIIKRLKEDGERLASTYVIEVFPHEWVCRGGCHHWARFGEQIEHSPDCPITLHRALMKEVK